MINNYRALPNKCMEKNQLCRPRYNKHICEQSPMVDKKCMNYTTEMRVRVAGIKKIKSAELLYHVFSLTKNTNLLA